MRLPKTLIITFLPLIGFAQREVKTYHDPAKKNIQEVYFVSREDDAKFVGKYLRYYPNGWRAKGRCREYFVQNQLSFQRNNLLS